MENIVAIILILIMIIFDTRSVGKFINITRPLKDGLNYSGKSVSKELFNMKSTLLNPKVVINKLNKSNLWVYNNNTVSSRHWKTFYSRRYLQPTSSLINLCIKSIIKHNHSLYNINIICDNDVDRLIPEYKIHINMCKSNYLKENLIKFAILFKYGGLWVPKDTLVLKPINSINDLYSYNFNTYGINNSNYNDKGISDQIVSSTKNDPLVKSLLQFLIKNTRGFQNAIEFKSSINKRFNQFIKTHCNHTHNNVGITEKCDGSHYHISDLFTTNIVKFKDYAEKSFIKLYLDDLENLREFNYILRLSETGILHSNLFLALLFSKSLL